MAPVPEGLQTAAKVGGGDAELGVGVGSGGPLAVDKELLCVGEGLGGAREEEGEDVDVGDWDGGVERFVRHRGWCDGMYAVT